MFTSQRKKWEDPHIVAIVELDAQKMWVRIVLAREAIRERLRELERPGTIKNDLRGLAKGKQTETQKRALRQICDLAQNFFA